MSNPFEFINSINSKDDIWDDKFSQKDYNSFMINNGLSYFADTVLYANELNKLSDVPEKCQYYFLFHSINKKKRFSKWVKKDEVTSDLELVMHYYNLSASKARDALQLLTDEQINVIKQSQYKGGRNEQRNIV